MKLRWIRPHPMLAPYVERMWLFESDFGLPKEDSRVVVPNRATGKIIIPYDNALLATAKGTAYGCTEGAIHFAGPWDRPVVISSRTRTTGTIGIELSALGVYRISKVDVHELRNRIVSFEDLFGVQGRAIQDIVSNERHVADKIEQIQGFLVRRIAALNRDNPLVDHVIAVLDRSDGQLAIRELERLTGYTRRYIDVLFRRMVGVPPKLLGAIFRFDRFYAAWARTGALDFYRDELHDFYFDQSHFIREFRRFSGMAPRVLAARGNAFGRVFHSRDEGG